MDFNMHIRVRRPGLISGGIYHHGVSLGDGTVVHFTRCEGKKFSWNSGTYMVVRSNIRAFASHGEIEVVDYSQFISSERNNIWNKLFGNNECFYNRMLRRYCQSKGFSQDEIIERCLAEVGNTKRKYSPAMYNCEDFASDMIKGIPLSEQVLDQHYWNEQKGSTDMPIDIFADYIFARKSLPDRGWLYFKSVYKYCAHLFKEEYEDPFISGHYHHPANWAVGRDIDGSWSSIDMHEVPYPLYEVKAFEASDSGRIRAIAPINYDTIQKHGFTVE